MKKILLAFGLCVSLLNANSTQNKEVFTFEFNIQETEDKAKELYEESNKSIVFETFLDDYIKKQKQEKLFKDMQSNIPFSSTKAKLKLVDNVLYGSTLFTQSNKKIEEVITLVEENDVRKQRYEELKLLREYDKDYFEKIMNLENISDKEFDLLSYAIQNTENNIIKDIVKIPYPINLKDKISYFKLMKENSKILGYGNIEKIFTKYMTVETHPIVLMYLYSYLNEKHNFNDETVRKQIDDYIKDYIQNKLYYLDGVSYTYLENIK